VSAAIWGGALGGVAAVGLLMVVMRVVALRRPQLDVLVLPYLRDVPLRDQPRVLHPASSSPTSAAAGIFGPVLHSAADLVERVLGGSTSVRRRLQRAGLDRSVQDFRIEQVVWGLVGFGAAVYSPAKYGILTELLPPEKLVPANGWIEGLTVMSIILGTVAGGALVSERGSNFLLGLDIPGVATGAEAIARLGTGDIPYDAVLCDLQLPGDTDGMDVIDAAKRLQPEALAVLVSGATGPDALQRLRHSGATLLTKPVAPAKLRALLSTRRHAQPA